MAASSDVGNYVFQGSGKEKNNRLWMKPEADAPSTCAQSMVRRANTEYLSAGGSGHNPQRIVRSALFFFKPDYTMIPSDTKQARPRSLDNDMRCVLTYCWRDGEEMKNFSASTPAHSTRGQKSIQSISEAMMYEMPRSSKRQMKNSATTGALSGKLG